MQGHQKLRKYRANNVIDRSKIHWVRRNPFWKTEYFCQVLTTREGEPESEYFINLVKKVPIRPDLQKQKQTHAHLN